MIPYPFQLRTRFGRWLPICTVHETVFSNRRQYANHYTDECSRPILLDMPESDELRHWKPLGYRRVWWWRS